MQFQALRGLWVGGARDEAIALSRRLLGPEQLHRPTSGEEFFVAGAANWVLDRQDRANYDFERSGRPHDPWHYSRYLA